eukprot:TRINITY_DN11788_c0_g1_i1.p1 TRINITY_DN11788_c0_g1~~TRINITY_DN11788_c0_g1_i1.p1  ORF type:complete len:330 (-),score=55.42 TRINITY_DN11788_c0_g1_i1:59-967(-)
MTKSTHVALLFVLLHALSLSCPVRSAVRYSSFEAEYKTAMETHFVQTPSGESNSQSFYETRHIMANSDAGCFKVTRAQQSSMEGTTEKDYRSSVYIDHGECTESSLHISDDGCSDHVNSCDDDDDYWKNSGEFMQSGFLLTSCVSLSSIFGTPALDRQCSINVTKVEPFQGMRVVQRSMTLHGGDCIDMGGHHACALTRWNATMEYISELPLLRSLHVNVTMEASNDDVAGEATVGIVMELTSYSATAPSGACKGGSCSMSTAASQTKKRPPTGATDTAHPLALSPQQIIHRVFELANPRMA